MDQADTFTWTDNVAIAYGVTIENVYLGEAGDSVIGNDVANVLRGNGGDDTLSGGGGGDTLVGGVGADQVFGGAGADTLQGEADADTLRGEAGIDSLFGGAGDDILIGGADADLLAGGAGIDTADYSAAAAGVSANLAGAGTLGDALGDTCVSVEAITGSAFADTLSGRDFVADTLNGGDGDDVLMGRYGGDVLNGGAGIDTLSYVNSLTAVEIRLFSNIAAGGEANGDTYSSIENIIGSTRFDVLAGDDNVNVILGEAGGDAITGRGGADVLHGEAGGDVLLGGADDDLLIGGAGADTLGGGDGNDTADYSASAAGVTVNLATGLGAGGDAQGDGLVSIENVIGSAFDDVIIGKANTTNNVFDGRGGNDTYTGGLGNDVFVFRAGSGADTVTDFSPLAASNNDAVQLAGFGAGFDSFAEVIAAASLVGAHTVIDFGAGQTLTLQNTTLASLTSNDFIFG